MKTVVVVNFLIVNLSISARASKLKATSLDTPYSTPIFLTCTAGDAGIKPTAGDIDVFSHFGFKKNLSAFKPSEHPLNQREKLSKHSVGGT